jgi:Flp pilus assembly protein TadG
MEARSGCALTNAYCLRYRMRIKIDVGRESLKNMKHIFTDNRLRTEGSSRTIPAKNRRRTGCAIFEFSLLMPWYLLLFIGAFDYGFYAYSLIASQSAATVAALYCATSSSTVSDSTTACGYALDQFRNLPNVGSSMNTCGTGSTVTAGAPVAVSASSVTGPDLNPATSVTVVYLTPRLIPIPGLLPGQLTITRTVKMSIYS